LWQIHPGHQTRRNQPILQRCNTFQRINIVKQAPPSSIFGLILRCQIVGFSNAVLATVRDRPAETICIALGALFLIAYQGANLYVDLAQEAAPIRLHWPQILQSATASAILAGLITGTLLTRQVKTLANAPWLAVLPWRDRARQDAIRRGALWLAAPVATGIFLLVWMAATATHTPHALLSAFVPFCAFATSCLAATSWPLRAASDASNSITQPARNRRLGRLRILLSQFDQQTPRWAGRWALGDTASRLASWWLASLVIGGGAAGCVSLAQHLPWPSLMMGVVGGHLVFLSTLRATPLLSPVLRSAPVRYAAAWAAVLRLPLVLSFAWLIFAAPPALAAQHNAWRAVPGFALGLLVLNAFFAAALATVPGSRRQALLLHALGLGLMLQQTVEYGLAYGIVASVLIAAVAVILVFQARRRFRANG
jgi:hypothetical protein